MNFSIAGAFALAKEVFFDITSWAALLLCVWVYNLVSLIIPNFYAGVAVDLLSLVLVYVLLGLSRSNSEGLHVSAPKVFAFFVSITVGFLVTPGVEAILDLDKDSLSSFVVLIAVTASCQMYLERLFVNKRTRKYILARMYFASAMLVIFLFALNYRLSVYMDMKPLSGLLTEHHLEKIDEASVFIMTNSALWVVENV